MIQNQATLLSVLSLGILLGGCATATRAPRAPAATTAAPTAAAKRRSTPDVVDYYVASLRNDLSHGKVGIFTDVMHLSSEESNNFWPIYQEYENELFELGDQRVEGIRQFAKDESSGRLDNAEATQLSNAYFGYETKRLELLKKYYGIIAEQLSPVRAAQFTQIEHRVGTVVDLLIASELPLIKTASSQR